MNWVLLDITCNTKQFFLIYIFRQFSIQSSFSLFSHFIISWSHCLYIKTEGLNWGCLLIKCLGNVLHPVIFINPICSCFLPYKIKMWSASFKKLSYFLHFNMLSFLFSNQFLWIWHFWTSKILHFNHSPSSTVLFTSH